MRANARAVRSMCFERHDRVTTGRNLNVHAHYDIPRQRVLSMAARHGPVRERVNSSSSSKSSSFKFSSSLVGLQAQFSTSSFACDCVERLVGTCC